MLGRAYMTIGQYRDAVEAWSWVQQLAPGDPQAAGALEQLRAIARQGGRHPPTQTPRHCPQAARSKAEGSTKPADRCTARPLPPPASPSQSL